MIWEVLVLGFVLSLDNFRVSIVLGTVPFSMKRAVQVALTFGLWDAIMPLVGLQLGRAAAGLIRIRPDLLAGVTLIMAAVALPLVFGG